MKKIQNIVALFAVAFILCLPTLTNAQPFDDDVDDNPVPFDGGITLLIAAGIGYGLNKVKETKKVHKL